MSRTEPTVLPLADFLAAFGPAYLDLPWEEVAAELVRHPAERNRIDLLRAERARRGHFNRPIKVTDEGRVADGMHRIVASILDQVPTVTFTGEADEPDPNIVTVEVHFTTTVHDPTQLTGDPRDQDDTDEDLLLAIDSFPMSRADGSSTWVNCDTFARHLDTLTGYWYLDEAADLPLLLSELPRRAAQFGFTLTVVSAQMDVESSVTSTTNTAAHAVTATPAT